MKTKAKAKTNANAKTNAKAKTKTKTKAKTKAEAKAEEKAIYSIKKFSFASECVITTHSDADRSAGQKVTVAIATDSTFHF